MTEQKQQPDTEAKGGPAQRTRWVMYGSNVVIFCIAAIAIAVIVNWLSATQLAGKGAYTRFDLTATRSYSLSPQTRRLLGSLETDLNIVLLYAAGTQDEAMMDNVEDLLDEYRSRSSRIDVRHIDPAADPPAFDALLEKLLSRYEDEVKVTHDAIVDAKKLYGDLSEFAGTQQGPLGDLFVEVDTKDPATIKTIQDLANVFRTVPDTVDSVVEDITKAIENTELPDYGNVARVTSTNLQRMKQGVFGAAITQFRRAIDAEGTSDKGKDALLGLVKQYESFADRIDKLVERLNGISLSNYAEFRRKIGESNGVVIYKETPDEDDEHRGMIALTLDEIYPVQRRVLTQQGVVEDRSYEGEETITGATLKLVTTPTKAVFVNSNRAPALGRRGEVSYNVIAAQLRKMNFVVEEWQPGGAVGPGGRPLPPRPAPTAEPGQKMVFIVLPNIEPPNPQMPFNPAEAAAGRAVGEHLASGGSAVVIVAPNLSGGAVPNDPISPALTLFGVSVNRDVAIQTRVPGQGGQLQSVFQMPISDYPGNHPIVGATNGLESYVMAGLPIEIAPDAPEGVTVAPLARTPADTWAETDLSTLGSATKGDDEKEGPFNIAVAAQRESQRLVVFSDVYFGTDRVVMFADRDTGKLRFPGNGEMFANAIYWTAGLDDMVAMGSRSQDTRRIEHFSPGTERGVWWALLAGLPLLCLLLGVVVYTIRRR